MSAYPTDVLIAKAGGRESLAGTAAHANVLLAKQILGRIEEGKQGSQDFSSPGDTQRLEEALHLIELRCLDLSRAWRRDVKSKEGVEFRDFCSLAFDIRRVLPFREDADQRVKDAIRLAAVGVLGERTADIRRFLIENPWAVPSCDDPEMSWPRRVLFTVANAFLRVVRKKDWNDLHAAAEAIRSLRECQQTFEKEYLAAENGQQQAAALELVAFYHLAKAVEILGVFVGKGTPRTVLDDVDFHLSKAVDAADSAGIIELALLLRWIRMASRSMIRATIWHTMAAYNSQMTDFKKALTDELQTRPLFELLPPQRDAIQEVMNTGNRAVVVEMPTSSGKTLLAEFRIIQTKVNLSKSWIAYLVPTRALVNQITVRLRRDLGPLNIKVEQATPAYELDPLEEELLQARDSFDVLVTTPEKLDLIVRNGALGDEEHPLGLVVLDEAHNLGDGERGLRSELVLATINRESPDTHFLLLTPFIPNAKELATWLDDERSSDVTPSLALNWQPNDQMLALAYPSGRGRAWSLEIKPLHVSQPHKHPISFDERVSIERERQRPVTFSEAKSSKLNVAALTAKALAARGSSIVLAYSPADCWNLADKLQAMLPDKSSENLRLVREFVAAECGEDFALYSLLAKGIGVHHSGISPEIRSLLEWLTEEGDLAALISTTTLAQGVNFPISNVILSTWQKPIPVGGSFIRQPLRPDEFWNIAGRAGRLFQDTLGLVLFASQTPNDEAIESYVNDRVVELASALEAMIQETVKLGWELDLRRLVRNDAKWSSFVQFLAHSYKVTDDHAQFISETEKLLKRTYAYYRMSEKQPDLAEQLVEATRKYAEQLKKAKPGVMTLVDLTGFSPETVTDLLQNKDSFTLSPEDWSPSRLFQSGAESMRGLVGALLQVPELNIPTVGSGHGQEIASMLQKWVSGKSLREIADAHFSDIEDLEKRMTECCRMVYRTITNQGSWGFGALQAMSGLSQSELSDEANAEIRSIPSMIYFGVPTVEAVIMRNLGVPRSLSQAFGSKFRAEGDADNKTVPRIQEARLWLNEASAEKWQTMASESGVRMSGDHLKKAWNVITGNNASK
ncbi:MAG: DEAD/DEAH box helicase [Opitutales bacterium]